MTLVGYSSEHKAYRMLDMRTGEIKISRDVRFLEFSDEFMEAKSEDIQPRSAELDRPADTGSVEWPLEDFSKPANVNDDAQSEEDFYGWDDDEADWPGGVFEGYDCNFWRDDDEDPEREEQPQPVRRSGRATAGVPPARYTDGVCLAVHNVVEPRSFHEAINGPQSADWKSAMDEEILSHQENGTWELVQLPQHRKVIGSKWIYKCKVDENGQLVRYKARLVAQGYCQKYGLDYDLVFAPVVKQTTFRAMLTLASTRKMLAKHIDIKTAYLYGQLQEEIYMRQPPGYEIGNQNDVCRLRRSLYGLKQAARVWNERIDSVLKAMGFHQSQADPCLYILEASGTYIFLLIYVDDIIVICSTETEFANIVETLNGQFKITVMGDLKLFLGIQVRLEAGQYRINQRAYLCRLFEKFGMKDAKTSKVPMDPGFLQQKEEASERLDSVDQYQSLIGALLYVAVSTRPDISIATSILGRRVQAPTVADWNEAKRILRYLKHTVDLELCLGHLGEDNKQLECYVDADWAGDISDRKSSSGYLFKFHGGVIDWSCRKQKCVALSSTEAEYIALAECLQEVLWIRKLMDDIGEQLDFPIPVKEDNQSCIALTKADRNEKKSKHIDTKYNFVKDLVHQGVVRLQYCPSEHMEADLLTKPLPAVKLKNLRSAIGIKPISVEEEC